MRGQLKENTPPFLLLMSFHGTVHSVEKESPARCDLYANRGVEVSFRTGVNALITTMDPSIISFQAWEEKKKRTQILTHTRALFPSNV